MLAVVHKLRFLSTFVRLSRDLSRLDLVFKLGDGLDPRKFPALRAMLEQPRLRAHLDGELPLPTIDLPALRRLPEGSFGRAAAAFFDARGLDPRALYHTGPAGGSDFDRFKQHMQRTHDLWHVVTGFETDVPGELGLQAFVIAQTGGALSFALLAAGLLKARDDLAGGARLMDAITEGWRMGKAAGPFFGVDWASMYTWPLEQVRARLGIAAPAAN